MKLLNLVLATLSISGIVSASTEQSVSVWTWPLSASAPKQLALVTYNPNTLTSAVSKYTPPSPPHSPDELIRVGLYDTKNEPKWTGVAVTSDNFASEYQQLLTLHVDASGVVFHVGITAYQKPVPSFKGAKDDLLVEVVRPVPGPTPILNKPVVLTPDGKVQSKEDEKSFLQKYWYYIAFFLVIQLFMGGSKE